MKTTLASTSNTLYLDQTSQRLALAYVANTNSEPPLALSRRVPWRVASNSLRCVLNGPPSESLFSLIGASKDRFLWGSTSVVLGISVDPFHGGFASLGETMKSIEMILENKPKKLILQTRSPLSLLATPLFRSRNNVELRIALETVEDEVARRFLPHLPRPSERLEAIETLRATGIPTSVQISPIIPKHLGSERVERFVQRLATLEIKKYILPLHELLSLNVENPLKLLSKSQHLLLGQADRILALGCSRSEAELARLRA